MKIINIKKYAISLQPNSFFNPTTPMTPELKEKLKEQGNQAIKMAMEFDNTYDYLKIYVKEDNYIGFLEAFIELANKFEELQNFNIGNTPFIAFEKNDGNEENLKYVAPKSKKMAQEIIDYGSNKEEIIKVINFSTKIAMFMQDVVELRLQKLKSSFLENN